MFGEVRSNCWVVSLVLQFGLCGLIVLSPHLYVALEKSVC